MKSLTHRKLGIRRGERGIVLLAVLILTALIVTTAVAYARHVAMAGTQTAADLNIHRAQEAAESGVTWARQALRSGADSQVATVPNEDGNGALVTLTGSGASRDMVVDSTDFYGLGATVIARASVTPDGEAGLLPELSSSAIARINASSPTILTDGAVLSDTVIAGVLLIEKGARVVLRDVVVSGAVLSELALESPPYKTWEAATLRLEGSVRIEPGAALPECSVVMPAGAVFASSATSVEMGGVVVARRMTLDGLGSLNAPIAVEGPLLLSGSIDQPGAGRGPRPWPAALEFAAHQLTTLAFPRFSPSTTELKAIASFPFPVKPTSFNSTN